MTRWWLVGGLVGAVACGTGAPVPEAAPTVTAAPVEARVAELRTLLDDHWQAVLRTRPELASSLGDRRYNDRWSDPSSDAERAWVETQRALLARARAIDPAGLPEQDALSLQLLTRQLSEAVEDARWEPWLLQMNQLSGPHLELAETVAVLPFDTVKDYEDYVARLRAVPSVLERHVAVMREGMSKGLMPPRVQLELAAAQVRAMSTTTVEESAFAGPVRELPATIPADEQARLRTAVHDAIREVVLPAYATFAAFVTDTYAPAGRPEPGLWSLPDGNARYATLVARSTTTTMTPAEIHALGEREVARIEAEEAAIGARLGFVDLAAFRAHVRGNRDLLGKSREDILQRYQVATDQMYAKLPELFGRLPAQRMLILPTEPYKEKEAAGAEYIQGTPDGSRPGTVRVNTYNPTALLTVDMESTAYHEGVPGHHLQIAIQQELGELPPFRQQADVIAFVEGWALYSEALGKEAGFFTDPYSDYGRLEAEMLRAIRLVVDTGVHADRWSRQQVVDYFHAHSTYDEINVQSETDRYIVWPGQALGYKVGQLTILRLREASKAALGDRFDVRAFHDEVLGAGAMPLDVLEARIDAWVARVKAAP